jgi:hypothetical protein
MTKHTYAQKDKKTLVDEKKCKSFVKKMNLGDLSEMKFASLCCPFDHCSVSKFATDRNEAMIAQSPWIGKKKEQGKMKQRNNKIMITMGGGGKGVMKRRKKALEIHKKVCYEGKGGRGVH